MKRYIAGCLLFLLFHGRMKQFLIILSVLVCSINAYAVTNNLSDCSQTTVQNAINSASTGDIINCPAGSWSWGGGAVNINKNITLQGAGIGNTNISSSSSSAIVNSSGTHAFRFTGFTITTSNNVPNGVVRVYTSTGSGVSVKTGWRIDHIEFVMYSSSGGGSGPTAIETFGVVGGLIDNCRFVPHPSTSSSNGYHATISVMGNNKWGWEYPSPMNGGDKVVYIEDNFFHQDTKISHIAHAVYGRAAGIYVFRHNEVRGMNADAHGFCWHSSTRWYEISNNVWNSTDFEVYDMMSLRGGSGVIYGNTQSGQGSNYGIHMYDWHAGRSGDCGTNCSSSSSLSTYDYPGYGSTCGGDPCSSNEGYPCAQGIGRGQDSEADPLYIWNNSMGSFYRPQEGTYQSEGVDYFLDAGAKPGYVSYPYPHPLTGGQPLPPPPPPPPPGNQIPNPPSSISISSGADATTPMLGTHTPASGETGWPVTNWFVDFDITDDEGIDETSLLFRANDFSNHPCGDAYVTCSWNTNPTSLHVRYTYTRDWEPNQTHTLNILQIDDTSGNRLTTSWSFSTGP